LNGRIDSPTLRAALASGSLGSIGEMVARRILTARELVEDVPSV
jgi:hypothetical protein